MDTTTRAIITALLMSIPLGYSPVSLSQTAACEANGETLSLARQAYNMQCGLPRADCDIVEGQWLCSSSIISSATNTDTSTAGALPPLATSTTQISNSTPTPILSATAFPDFGQQNGVPVCLSDSNSQNGYGFENGRSCILAPGITATKQNPLVGQRLCVPWMEISYGNHLNLQNNTWNDSGVFTDNWSQCITLNGTTGNYIASWDYNWLNRSEGEEFSVKSYPQVSETGLPASIKDLPQITVDFTYTETGNAERNVALESFLHTSCEAEEDNKFFEMMVWVASPSIRTPGTLVTTAQIDGRNWSVYTNPQLSWGYVAFVSDRQLNEGTLNWNAFIDWSRLQGPAFGVPPTGDNTCLGAIELGTETFWGNGSFSLEQFDINLQR